MKGGDIKFPRTLSSILDGRCRRRGKQADRNPAQRGLAVPKAGQSSGEGGTVSAGRAGEGAEGVAEKRAA